MRQLQSINSNVVSIKMESGQMITPLYQKVNHQDFFLKLISQYNINKNDIEILINVYL